MSEIIERVAEAIRKASAEVGLGMGGRPGRRHRAGCHPRHCETPQIQWSKQDSQSET